jgi:rubredoxin
VFTLDFSLFALLYVAAGLVVVFGLWFYYDWRDKNIYQEVRSQMIFHCVKCGHIYTASRGKEVATCPQCGFENNKLKF